jgi:hypothetical protein
MQWDDRLRDVLVASPLEKNNTAAIAGYLSQPQPSNS